MSTVHFAVHLFVDLVQHQIKIWITALALLAILPAGAQKWSQQVARTAMTLWSGPFNPTPGGLARWSYDQGVILKGIEDIWNATGDSVWFNYFQRSMDHFVQEDGSILGYRPDEFNIDHVNNGKLLLTLYRVTGQEKYKKAVQLLRSQLQEHPRTSEGGFWHKKIYPRQMWLEGLYMGQPFYAEYAQTFGEDTIFNDVTRQFVLMEKYARDGKTGLLLHGWDESRQQKWSDPKTGLSPHVWGRALGWFGMALVDALDYYPQQHPGRARLIAILQRFAKGVTSVQDAKTGLWYNIPNLPKEPKNYFEASASSMLVYTLAKGMRMGYLPQSYMPAAQKGYAGIVERFIKTENGATNLHGTVKVSGLGGNPYRDGSFEYYMSEPVMVNDPKGVGAFINCAVEMEMVPQLSAGRGKTVLLDQFFNNETREFAGKLQPHHYTWEDRTHGGFYLLGSVFQQQGARLATLSGAPTAASLKDASVYLIVDPDTDKESKSPNYLQPAHIQAIAAWVKAGGTLLLMGNDSVNAEFTHFNQLANVFGVHFNQDIRNRVQGSQFEQGAVMVPAGHPVFATAQKLFIKEYASLALKAPAKPVLVDKGHVVMAEARYGKGRVIAIGDPWLYNEYTDGRRLPTSFQNHTAAVELARWLLKPAAETNTAILNFK